MNFLNRLALPLILFIYFHHLSLCAYSETKEPRASIAEPSKSKATDTNNLKSSEPLAPQKKPTVKKNIYTEYSYSIPFFHTLTAGYVVSPNILVTAEIGQGGLTYDGISINIQHSGINIQYSPWEKGFFVSGGLGQHKVRGKRSELITLQDPILMPIPMQAKVDAQVDLSANYSYASIGWNFLFFKVVNLSLSAGVINPTSPSTTIKAQGDDLSSQLIELAKTTGDYQKMEADAIEQSNSYGKKQIPKIAIGIGSTF